MNYLKLGQEIRKIRKEKGLSQEELAEKIDISTTHMSHIETGNTKCSLAVFVMIVEALEVSADRLLENQQNNLSEISFKEITSVLKGCSKKEVKIISDVVKALKKAMDQYAESGQEENSDLADR